MPPSCPKSVVVQCNSATQQLSSGRGRWESIAHLPVVSHWLHDPSLSCPRHRTYSRESPTTTTTTTTNPTRHDYVSNRRTNLLLSSPLSSAAAAASSSSSSSSIFPSTTTTTTAAAAAVHCRPSRNLAHRVRRRGARLPSTSSFGAAGQNLPPRVRTEIRAPVPAAAGQEEEATPPPPRPTALLLPRVLTTPTPHRPHNCLPSASACPRPARNSSRSRWRCRIAASSQRQRRKKGSARTWLLGDSLPPACQGRTCWRSPLLLLQQVRR
ncbi:unnamed protein product [Ectocarpus sp. 12 AP-2014]